MQFEDDIGFGGDSHGGVLQATASVQMVINVTATYNGPKPVALSGASFIVSQSMGWSNDAGVASSTGQAEVHDYFGAPTRSNTSRWGQPSYYFCSDYKASTRLVRVSVDSNGVAKFSFPYTMQLTSPAPPSSIFSYMTFQYFLEVAATPRKVEIGVPGHDANNMRKVYTGATKQLQVANSAGTLINIGFPYAIAVPAPQLPAGGILDFHREIDLGLTLDKATDAVGPDDSLTRTGPNPIPFTYTPLVTQLFSPSEHYSWLEKLDEISASADLPRTVTIQYPQWVIENLTATYKQPLVVSRYAYGAERNRTYEGGDRAKDDSVRLHYEWNDGLTGDASVTTHLHQAPVDDWSVIGALPEVLPNEDYVDLRFQTGESDVPGRDDHYWSVTGNPYPQNVGVPASEVNWIQAESAAAAGFAFLDVFATDGLGPWLGFGSALLGESTNFTGPPDAKFDPWTYAAVFDCDKTIAEWNKRGRVTPSAYQTMMPLRPDQNYWQFVRWHVDGQPATITQYYLADKWGPNGYEGQAVTSDIPDAVTRYKGNPLDGHLLYRFDFPSLRSGGPGGDPMFPGGGDGGTNPPGGGGGQ